MGKQFKRVFEVACAIVITIIAINPTYTSAVDATLGDIESYNAIIANDYQAGQADSEGALAIGGNLHAPSKSGQTYTIGAAYPGAGGQHIGGGFDPTKVPALLLAGTYQNSGNGSFVEGNLTASAPIFNGMEVTGVTTVQPQTTIKNHITAMINQGSTYLEEALNFTLGMKIDGGQGYNGSKIDFFIANEDSEVNIGMLESINGKSEIGEIYVPSNVLSQEAIIVYSPAEVISFIPGGTIYNGKIVDTNQLFDENSDFTKVASKVLYYFPNATEVKVNQTGIIGSVFAPNAKLVADGGAVNGQGIFDSVDKKNGFEFHNFSFNWRRKLQTGRIEITKYVAGTTTPLVGASFKAVDKIGTVFGPFTTNTEGKIVIENIPFGEYLITEIQAPEGYLNSHEDFHIIIDSDHADFHITAENEEIIGDIEILKRDSITFDRLQGAIFGIKNAEGTVLQTATTDSNGLLQFNNIPYGSYYLFEVQAPEGYDTIIGEYPVTIQDNVTLSFTANNTIQERGKIEILKVDPTNVPLAGAVYTITSLETGALFTMTTDSLGYANLSDLEYGKYSIQEVQAPPGFILDGTIRYFEINQTNLQLSYTHHNSTIPNVGPADGNLQLKKVDKNDNSIVLQGAIFELKNIDTELVYTITTDAAGEGEQLHIPFGNYQLTEIQAPPGYESSNQTIEFTLDELMFTMNYTFENTKIIENGSLEILKVDAETKNPLSGVTFTLTNKESGENYTLITDNLGQAQQGNLPYGDYTLVETTPPPGFTADPIIRELTISNVINQLSFTFENTKKEKELIVHKVDAENTTIPLSGVQFRLEDEAGNFIARGQTNTNGYLHFKGLDYKLNTVYLIEESTIPPYILDTTPIKVDISNPETQVYLRKITNTQKAGSLALQKVIVEPENNQTYDYTKIKIAIWGNGINEEHYLEQNGSLNIPNLKAGTYFIQEKEVPDNVVLDETIYKIIVESDKTTTFTLNNQAKKVEFSLWLHKVDENGQALQNIPFELIGVLATGEEQSLGTKIGAPESLDGIVTWSNLSPDTFWQQDGTPIYQTIYAIERQTDAHPDIIQDLETKIPVILDREQALQGQAIQIKGESPTGDIINYYKEEITFSLWLHKVDENGQSLQNIPFELIGVLETGEEQSLGTKIGSPESLDGIVTWSNLSPDTFWQQDGNPIYQTIYAIERQTDAHPDIIQDLETKIPVILDREQALQGQAIQIKGESPTGDIINYYKEEITFSLWLHKVDENGQSLQNIPL